MKVSNVLLLIALMALTGGCYLEAKSSTVTTLYEKSDEDFPNPERGFFARFHPWETNPRPLLRLDHLQKLRSENITLARRIYLISEFRDKPLSESFLLKVSQDLETARKAGVKLIFRFAYNWLGGGDDAPTERIVSHLEQLKPILAANYDAIAYMEAGFIGYWGEWNRSSNGLRENRSARREILLKVLSVLPTERMVALRYSYYKGDIFYNQNFLTPDKAFNGSDRARTGAHNECFLAGIDDWGTYNHTDPEIVDRQKTFLSLDNRYVVQGGEVCNPSKYDDCPNALTELGRMRWSALNVDPSDGKEILQDWETQGCMKEIKRRLGYRFRLLKSIIPEKVKPGGRFSLKFEIVNDGWASPYNPRSLEVILRNSGTGNEYYLPVNEKPQMWMPGVTKVVNILGGIPANMPPGEYEVLLNLPDPTPRLSNRPEYSIRLANQNVWEESTGYNSLLQRVIVDGEIAGSDYSGFEFFQPRVSDEGGR